MNGLAIDAQGLVKVFGEQRAVDNLDLKVPTGSVYGVLGPNGAGKTTTIRMLATLLPLDGGRATVGGFDVATQANQVRQSMSLAGQFASLDEDLTGWENLVMLSRLYGYSRAAAKERAMELFEAFGLVEAKDKQVKAYSGGMRRRVDIAASLIVTTDLMFLDEPTTGLDPRSRNQVWDIVRALVDRGTTVLLTTQYLEEADQLADRIAVIDHGHVIAEGTSGELKSWVGSGVLHLRLRDVADARRAKATLELMPDLVLEPVADPIGLAARVPDATVGNQAVSRLTQEGIVVDSFSVGQPSLDEVFLALTGDAPDKGPAGAPAGAGAAGTQTIDEGTR